MGFFKTISLSAAAAAMTFTIASAAVAETFTFESTATPGDGVTLELPDGRMIAAGSNSGTSTATFAGGESQTSNFKCHSMSEPPSQTFQVTGLCEVTDQGVAGNNFKVLFGCNFTNEERTASSCWGGLFGTGGRFDGKTGTISWSAKDNASKGTGQWND